MQGPTDEAEASIPTETLSNGPDPNQYRTVTVRRKAAKRSERWYQNLAAPLSIPARKKQRREEPLLTTTDEAARETASRDISVGLPSPASHDDDDDDDDSNANAVPVTDTQPIAATSRAPRRPWKPKEDTLLKEAAKKHGNRWVAVAAMVPCRTDKQCFHRWVGILDPANGKKTGKWTPKEDAKLTEAVKKHGNKCWVAVATMVTGRTSKRCREHWVQTLDPVSGNKGQWTPEEDAKLKDAVEKHGKDCWAVVAALVPDRTSIQCRNRWIYTLDPANGNTGRWKPEEDAKLTEAVKKHGKNWVATAAMFSGRTKKQCRSRWTQALDPANGDKGKWKPEEDVKLTEAVKRHDKDWVSVAAMVSGRTNQQCRSRWTQVLDPATGKNTGKWTPGEDAKLTEAVHKHEKDWVAVAAMVSGRTNQQCRSRWTQVLDPSIAKKRAGEWTPEEDAKLTEAVKEHGKNWVAIAAMVPSRTNQRCRKRWTRHLDPERASTQR
jgi:hypothetical protein